MSEFELIEVPLNPDSFNLSLEDHFLVTRIKKELEQATSIEELRTGATKLLELAVARQAVIRSLIKRIADLELDPKIIRRRYED